MKSQRGSITLYVLVSVLFFVFILALIYVNFINKLASEQNQIEQIQSDYNQYDTEDKLDDLYANLTKEPDETLLLAGDKVENLLNKNEEIIGEIISDGDGGEVAVPKDFYYVGGTINTGIVISDNVQDKNQYAGKTDVGKDLEGNQFVWVPVDGEKLTYAQDHIYDSVHSSTYTDYNDWTDNGGNAESVATYGGFYIGRYEAGWSEEVTDGSTYTTSKNITSKTPISKAGVASWNCISQTNTKTVSANMYSSSVVTSSLVDSYAWDTTVNWLKNMEIIEETSDGKINSSNYGNYYNNTTTILTNVLYARHTYNNTWIYATNYEKGAIILPAQAGGTTTDRIELETGASEDFKTNNIYDLAGNMWEWTTEEGKHNANSNAFAVHRGGSFNHNGSSRPVVYRYGNATVGGIDVNVGFRVVLYVN